MVSTGCIIPAIPTYPVFLSMNNFKINLSIYSNSLVARSILEYEFPIAINAEMKIYVHENICT